MNKKDYKVIVEICKKYRLLFQPNGHEMFCGYLADYFEKEDKENNAKMVNFRFKHIRFDFNRKQFLKECGLKN